MLRAKYLDWCSARLAERFLRLTPEEIYELAQRASPSAPAGSGSADSGGAEALPSDAGPVESFRHIVERVTVALAVNLDLPVFEQWAAAYREQPSRYDDELLGFWTEQEAE